MTDQPWWLNFQIRLRTPNPREAISDLVIKLPHSGFKQKEMTFRADSHLIMGLYEVVTTAFQEIETLKGKTEFVDRGEVDTTNWKLIDRLTALLPILFGGKFKYEG